MAKKINRPEDLAEWFYLNNYLAASKFDTKEWYRQIYLRQILMYYLIMRKTPQFARRANEVFARDIKGMRGAVEDCDIPGVFGAGGYEKYLSDAARGVVSLTPKHLREHAHNTPGFSVELMESISKHPRNVTDEEFPLFLTGGQPVIQNRFATCRIDLERPNALLIESFKALLSEIPDVPGLKAPKKIYHLPNFEDWARYGLLPYLDLLIWKTEIGVQIPHRVMAFAIKTGYVSGDKQLSDTVIPLARRLMNGDIDELLDIMAMEANASSRITRTK